MGAGNTVRWIDHPELKRRLNVVVDGIEECRQPNGYIMAYPEDTIFYSERATYTRAAHARSVGSSLQRQRQGVAALARLLRLV